LDRLSDFIKRLSSVKCDECVKTVKMEAAEYGVYPDSLRKHKDKFFFLAKVKNEKVLVIVENDSLSDNFLGVVHHISGVKVRICELSNRNCHELRKVFTFMNPKSHRTEKFTFGLGDRLGLASAGHLRLIKDKNVFPVLAQQSIREITLTARDYDDVICAACWAVFQEGYTKGFGADGDHLKTKDEVKMAIDHGFTMITLDCSDYIGGRHGVLTDKDLDEKYNEIDDDRRQLLELKYLDKCFKLINGRTINFTPASLKEATVLYLKAIDFAADVYHNLIEKCGRDIDFEMSVDETYTATTPEAHFFVASELFSEGVRPISLAPKFCGEFQKGIDYKGNIEQFEREFAEHAEIAGHFGYKLSIHSGSDKFSIFPIIADKTNSNVHVKTAGTNWLEALRVIAEIDPSLFVRIYDYAVKSLLEAKKYYHVAVDEKSAPDVTKLDEDSISSLLVLEESRQILHITYGALLLAKNDSGKPLFKDLIYDLLNDNEELYYEKLAIHIGNHMMPFQ